MASVVMEKWLWICPHAHLTFTEAQSLMLYHPPDASDNYVETLPPCISCGFSISTSMHHRLHSTTPNALTLCTTIKLWSARDYESAGAAVECFAWERVALAMASVDIPICLHNRMSGWNVAKRGRRGCLQLKEIGKEAAPCFCNNVDWGTRRPHGKHFGHCPGCHFEGTYTQFGFEARERIENERRVLDLVLIIWRDLGTMEADDISSPQWNLHALNHFDTGRTEKTWSDWTKFMSRRYESWGPLMNRSTYLSWHYHVDLYRAVCRYLITERKRARAARRYMKALRSKLRERDTAALSRERIS